jgi:cytoskeletal protein CcmA (bactofilin family)
VRSLRLWSIFLLACVVAALAVPGHALAFQQLSGTNVIVSQPVSDDLFLFGTHVEVSAPVDGDVFAFGQTVLISGDVSGTVVASGQIVRVTGTVSNSVRAAGQDIQIGGSVLKDLMAAGATVRVTGGGSVGRDAVVGGQTILLGGDVGRNVLVGANSLTIASKIGGDVTADVTDLTVTDAGSIAGNLDYTSAQQANVQGQVAGTTTRHEPPTTNRREPNPAVRTFFGVVGWIRGLVGMFLFGIAAVLLSRGRLTVASDTLLERPWPSLGIGFAALLGVWPVATIVFLLGLLVGGWWISFVLIAAVWLLALVGLVVGSLALGKVLLGWMHAQLHPILTLGLGLLVIWAVGAVPFVGWLLGFAGLAFGTGAILLALYLRPARPGLPAEPDYVATPPGQTQYPPVAPPPYAPPGPTPTPPGGPPPTPLAQSPYAPPGQPSA